MSSTSQKSRPAWLDRFRAPTPADLLAPFNKQTTALIQHARDRLRAGESVKEEISFQGVWNWTFVYRIPHEGDVGWAYIIPDPVKPRIAIPVLDDVVPELPVRKLSKLVRDGLVHAPMVNGVRWATWDLVSKTQTDEIISLAEHALRLVKVER